MRFGVGVVTVLVLGFLLQSSFRRSRGRARYLLTSARGMIREQQHESGPRQFFQKPLSDPKTRNLRRKAVMVSFRATQWTGQPRLQNALQIFEQNRIAEELVVPLGLFQDVRLSIHLLRLWQQSFLACCSLLLRKWSSFRAMNQSIICFIGWAWDWEFYRGCNLGSRIPLLAWFSESFWRFSREHEFENTGKCWNAIWTFKLTFSSLRTKMDDCNGTQI